MGYKVAPGEVALQNAEEAVISPLDHAIIGLSSYGGLKRGLDILGSCAGLVLFAATYPFVATAIKLDSSGPVLVALDRVSRGRIIKLYKFRSMVDGAHAQKPLLIPFNERRDSPFFKMKQDPRLTQVGKVIRRFRLDEVPQFINVFRGELSLVGPRPHEPLEVAQYPDDYVFLTKHKAGITGLSQVNGASSLSFRKELELDAHYTKRVSLLLDIKIIAKTIAILLFDPSAV